MDHNRRAEILGEKPVEKRPSVEQSFDSYEKEFRFKKYLRGEFNLLSSVCYFFFFN